MWVWFLNVDILYIFFVHFFQCYYDDYLFVFKLGLVQTSTLFWECWFLGFDYQQVLNEGLACNSGAIFKYFKAYCFVDFDYQQLLGVTSPYNFGGFPLFLGRPCAGITCNCVLYIASIDVAMWVYSSFLFRTYVVMLVYPIFFFFLLKTCVLFWFFLKISFNVWYGFYKN